MSGGEIREKASAAIKRLSSREKELIRKAEPYGAGTYMLVDMRGVANNSRHWMQAQGVTHYWNSLYDALTIIGRYAKEELDK